MRTTVLTLFVLGRLELAGPALAAGLDGAAAIVLSTSLGSRLNEHYPVGVGVALELGLVQSERFRVSLSAAPQYFAGTPAAGSLADQADARFILLPAHGALAYTLKARPPRLYGGLGLGITYAHERLSYQSPLGKRERSLSEASLSWTVLAGVEGDGPSRWFAETHLQSAGTSGVEGQSQSGVSLASLELRAGWRTKLK
jgi:hypothetical protein